MKTSTYHHLVIALGFMLGTGALAQQTLNDLTTINGNLWVNPPAVNSDALTLEGAGVLRSFLNPGKIELQKAVNLSGVDLVSHSALLPGGLFLNTGRSATTTLDRRDWSGFISLNAAGTFPGMGFYADYVEGTLSSSITGSGALSYTWHRPLGGAGLSEDITLRSTPIMRLGGADNALTLMHPTDASKQIIVNPAAGTLTLHGKQVVTQSDAGSLAIGTGTAGTGLGSAAFGQNTTASGNMSLTAGNGNMAAGAFSAAIGAWTYAGGNAAMALGLWASAVGNSSVALAGPNIGAYGTSSLAAGTWTAAMGDRTIALGYGLRTTTPGQVVVGQWNDFNSPGLPADLVFVVGNGLEPEITATYDGRYSPETNPGKGNAIEVQLSGRTTIRHKNHLSNATAQALNVLGAAAVSRGLTVGGPAALSGGASINAPLSVTGAATVTGTLNVGGTTGTDGTVTAKKVRVPASGDIDMGIFTEGGAP